MTEARSTTLVLKLSNQQVIDKALYILTLLEEHLSQKPPCEHCAAILKEK